MTTRAWLLFAGMCVLWGIPYLLIRVAVRHLDPSVLVPRGHTITPSLLARLRNYPRGAVAEPLRVADGRDDRAAEAA